ncbi:MAG: ATP-binding protein, partial [Burkholderiales bacterium]
FHALLMRAPVAVVVLAGADYVFELANERFCKLSNRDVPAGKKLAEVFPELAGSPVMDLLKEAYEKAEPFAASEFPVLLDRNRDGALVQAYFDFNIEPLHGDDGALRLMASALDVTDHVNARRVRDDFLSIASHELKTPLTTLRLQGDALQRLVDKRRCSEETIAPKIVVMRRQIDRLGRLVKELLDVSSIAAGKLPLTIEEVDLSQLAHELVDRYRVELGAARCEVKLLADAPVVGQWDRLRLDQVLTNLLTNAMKYGRGRPIEIATESVDATNARLTVRDSGVGIAPEHQERIFQRFERAVTDRNFGGLGLGLWIVAQIVKDSGGQVRVESALGEGALFVVDLPKGAQRCGS